MLQINENTSQALKVHIILNQNQKNLNLRTIEQFLSLKYIINSWKWNKVIILNRWIVINKRF